MIYAHCDNGSSLIHCDELLGFLMLTLARRDAEISIRVPVARVLRDI